MGGPRCVAVWRRWLALAMAEAKAAKTPFSYSGMDGLISKIRGARW